jgi:flavin reductase (DIM6/NTAB) family NADH-FMN oxidoreductase RutF
MDIDAAFDKVVNGTAVVTVKAAEKANGMTAAWYTRVSSNPPMVAVSISYRRFTYELIKRSGFFCLNLLAEDQLAVAKKFGFSSGRDSDKFKDIAYRSAKSGSPLIEGIAGFLDCKVVKMVEAGDHMMFIGEVINAGATDKRPLPARMEDYA